MMITIDPKLEARIRAKAQAEGLTVDAYVERLVSADQAAEEELEALAFEGLQSGAPVEAGHSSTGKKNTVALTNG